MDFGALPVSDAQGCILAHALSLGTLRLKKGHVLSASDVMLLKQGGVESVVVARLQASDVEENAAAAMLASVFRGSNIAAANAATGRVNFHAVRSGLFCADRLLVDHLNSIDPAITFACLSDRSQVAASDLVATIKIIPFAVAEASLKEAKSVISAPAIASVRAFRPVRAGLIATRLPTLKESVMDKTRDTLTARLAASGSSLHEEVRVAYAEEPLAEEISRMARRLGLIVVFGASAVSDPDDVIPAAIRRAGGVVERVGMPVDPGNLLVLGSVGSVPVIGAPGCARSPRENGFDWVLARLLADDVPSARDLSRMGVGGLLKEIPSRPRPRQGADNGADNPAGSGISIVLLAAGRASRMGEVSGHKLLATFDGEPLVRKMARMALASSARSTVVVTGHREADIAASLEGFAVRIVHNGDFAQGMASSLKAGLEALEPDMSAALILLGDMPGLTSGHLDQLIAAFVEGDGEAIVRACDGARRGNPVILPRSAFKEAMALSGDVGARALVESGNWPVIDVDIGPAARLDVDTPEAVVAAGGSIEAAP